MNVIDNTDCEGYEHLQISAVNGLVSGLSYLHGNSVVHRDLKPDNILVTNQDYVHLYNQDPQAFVSRWKKQPLSIKLTDLDFGESRSNLIQTYRPNVSNVNRSSTSDAYRGSPAYMAPEILVPMYTKDSGIASVVSSLNHIKRTDVWSLAMVFYCLLSPDTRY